MDTARLDALSLDQRRVIAQIIARPGKANAIPVAEVARAVGIPARETQDLVASLIEAGLPIGTSYGRPSGWYMVETEAERAENRQALRGRALKILARARAFDPRARPELEALRGQVRLWEAGRG